MNGVVSTEKGILDEIESSIQFRFYIIANDGVPKSFRQPESSGRIPH